LYAPAAVLPSPPAHRSAQVLFAAVLPRGPVNRKIITQIGPFCKKKLGKFGMTAEQFQRELDYGVTMALCNEMLAAGLITEEFLKIDRL